MRDERASNQILDNIEGLISEISMRLEKAKTGITYALNLAFGEELADFERDNLFEIAKELGVKVSEKLHSFEEDRKILLEVLAERKKQVEVFGFTPEKDEVNPGRIHQEILLRVSESPSSHARKSYLEAAAILVAEIRCIDKALLKVTKVEGDKVSIPGPWGVGKIV